MLRGRPPLRLAHRGGGGGVVGPAILRCAAGRVAIYETF